MKTRSADDFDAIRARQKELQAKDPQITVLLPCPFCGGEADPEGWLARDGERGPECRNCGATASSIEAWNERFPPPLRPILTPDQVAEAQRAFDAEFKRGGSGFHRPDRSANNYWNAAEMQRAASIAAEMQRVDSFLINKLGYLTTAETLEQRLATIAAFPLDETRNFRVRRGLLALLVKRGVITDEDAQRRLEQG